MHYATLTKPTRHGTFHTVRPGTPCTKGSSNLVARRRIEQDATSTTQQGCWDVLTRCSVLSQRRQKTILNHGRSQRVQKFRRNLHMWSGPKICVRKERQTRSHCRQTGAHCNTPLHCQGGVTATVNASRNNKGLNR